MDDIVGSLFIESVYFSFSDANFVVKSKGLLRIELAVEQTDILI